ncbi:MAG: type VII secretion protein EssC [Breznakia sp.]
MNNQYLVIIHNGVKMFFTFEENDFSITKQIDDHQLFSANFEGIRISFLENSANVNDVKIEYNQMHTILHYEVIIYKNINYKAYIFNDTIVIGNDKKCDIVMDIKTPIFIECEKTGNRLFTSERIFVSGKSVHTECELTNGDYLFINNELIFVGEGIIKVRSEVESHLKEEYNQTLNINHKAYHRSPRLCYVVNNDTIKIDAPPTKPKNKNKGLIKLIFPPLIMLCVTVGISLFMGRGLFIIISITATLMTLIKSIISFFDERKEAKEEKEKRETKYQEYLVRKSIEINLRVQEELEAIHYQMLEPKEMIDLVKKESRRIYEKSISDADFLEVRIGKHKRKPSFQVDLPEQKITEDYDEMYEKAKKLKSNFKDLDNVGLSIKLTESNIGIIGTKELAVLIVEQILLEVMTFHSYHDVQFLTIFNQDQLKDLSWLSYAPNSKIDAMNIRGLVYNEVLRDQVLGSFVQILKDREQAYQEDNNVFFAPHYIISVLSSKLIKEHQISEFLNKDIRHLGVSIIVVESEIESLKENIKTVIEIYSRQRSKLLIEKGVYVRKDFNIDVLPSKEELLDHARILKGFHHVIGTENGLPKLVTFLEMYEVNRVEQLDIKARWLKNDSTKSLAVRIGVTGDDYVELNAHEKAHGPHGLLAGSTGSGKSETVQTYILSLGINFHPYEVAFLLIDFKGGGMAHMFAKLPHLIGTITNLDKDGAMRALVSIKAELLRRQEIFATYNINHIHQYTRLFKKGKAKQAMPHLFIISDEFAELKQDQPEFMSELVSTARIGRSLGIHLILATQKPSGVVDAQIWSNAKFRLCLKVQDAADSKEMLKTADAANIINPGRGYLQVGNNEIYELFQSAWSGANYFGENTENKLDKRIYMVNRLGQYKILTKDLSGINDNEKIEKMDTELEAVIHEIASVFTDLKVKKVKPIWVEELKKRYYLDDYIEIDFYAKTAHMMFGIVDIPSKQTQITYDKNLEDLGNIAILGSSGYGKSYTMISALLSIFSRVTVDEVYAYILDFGNNALINLRRLPHVAEYMVMEDEEKLNKFTRILSNIVDERKKLFSNVGANHISIYNQMVSEKLPSIIVAVDNFDIIKEEFDILQSMFHKLSRDCTSLGIYFMFSGQKASSFKASMFHNLKTIIALYGLDKYDYKNVIGRGEFLPKELPGSALVKEGGVASVMQVMLPAKGEDDVRVLNALNEKIAYICDKYVGKEAKGIMIVDENITTEEVLAEAGLKGAECTIGLDYESVAPIKYDLKKVPIISVISSEGRGKSNLIQFILSQNVEDIVVLDGADQSLKDFKKQYPYYKIAELNGLMDSIEKNELFDKILVTDSGDEFIRGLTAAQTKILMEKISKKELHLVIAYNVTVLREKIGEFTSALKTNVYNIVQTNPDNQSIVYFDFKAKKEKLKIGDVIVSNGTQNKKVRIPKIGGKHEKNYI